jgi:hypothetical protein
MTLEEMENAIKLLVRDSSLHTGLGDMIRDAIMELCADFDLPALRLITPVTLAVTTSDWIYTAPANYHKKLFKCMDSDENNVTICTLEDIEAADPLHTETGDYVDRIAVHEGGVNKNFCIYPKANATLYCWFYELPTLPTEAEDVIACIPTEYHYRVIVTKCILKNFRLFTDAIEDGPHTSISYWEEMYRQGLFGSLRGGDIGFINYIGKINPGRRHGGNDPLP